jgi:hypothetical protein
MRDFKLDIRTELLRVQPRLSVQQTENLIQEIPRCFRDVTRDNAACGEVEWQDFYNFSHVDGVALATIYRKTQLEVFTFAADDSLIHSTRHLAMVDVDEFLQIVRSRFDSPEAGFRLPMAQVLPWLESGEKV